MKYGFDLLDYIFSRCGYTYFNKNQLKGNCQVIQSNVISHVCEDFPPSFISYANSSSFPDQTRDLYNKLQELYISCQFNFYPKEQVNLMYGFEIEDTEYSKENLQKTLLFLS